MEDSNKIVEYPVGYLKVPANLEERKSFALSSSKFVAPRHVDLRDYCTKTENQGRYPWCAAYAGTSMVENLLWRRDDYPTQIDPGTVYRYAKQHDGDPNGDGTTLNAVLEYFLENKYFVDEAEIQYIYGKDICAKIRYCLHKWGVVLLGCNITNEWYLCNCNKTSIVGGSGTQFVGGHAILGCGYDDDLGGVIIQNSWDESFGSYGFALITWEELEREFMYGCVLTHSLDGLKMNC